MEFIVIGVGVSIFGIQHSGLSSLRVKNYIIDRWGKSGYANIFKATSIITLVIAGLTMWGSDWLYFASSPEIVNILLVSCGAILILISAVLARAAARVISVTTVADMRTDRMPELVTDGIYSRIRHPLYLATVLMLMGLALLYPFPRVIAFSLGMIFYTLIGSILEERKLIHHYGRAYLEYKKQAGFILPKIR
ncbi:MAG: isoprenylcysteine carboxylmethyltransferase family protein [Candidatus Thorarchaeota archaeon]|nr:MAG: isoprenylcysteine carboxylmethyltransferase family protein [Candidatus Thorarchaeota archaeon]